MATTKKNNPATSAVVAGSTSDSASDSDATARTVAQTGPTGAPKPVDPNAETLISQSGSSAQQPAVDQGAKKGSDSGAGGQAEPESGGRLAPGAMVGEYRVDGLLGQGGMGEVYAGEQPVIGKSVAIKVLNSVLSREPEMVRRFLAEAKAVNRINHRGIVDIFAFGELDDGSQYFVMELLRGETLTEFMQRERPPTYGDIRTILEELCDALAAAHEADVVHRDLKPDNIIVERDRRNRLHVKLLDFGIARFFEHGISMGRTRTGIKLGTPLFMAPEQGAGEHVDHRADLYALGVLMFQLFTGRAPFMSKSYLEILQAHSFEPPPRPSDLAELPEGLEAVILWPLEKDPAARPESVSQLWDRLEPVLEPVEASHRPNLQQGLQEGSPEGSPPPSFAGAKPQEERGGGLPRAGEGAGGTTRNVAPYGVRRRRRRLAWILGLLALVLAAAAGGIGAWYLRGRGQERRQQENSERKQETVPGNPRGDPRETK